MTGCRRLPHVVLRYECDHLYCADCQDWLVVVPSGAPVEHTMALCALCSAAQGPVKRLDPRRPPYPRSRWLRLGRRPTASSELLAP